MKDTLQITISKVKSPKSKLGKWFYWNIYFTIWRIWKPKIMAKIYLALSNFFLMFIPKSKREKILKEFENIDVVIKNKTDENGKKE